MSNRIVQFAAESSDRGLIELLRRRQALGVGELAVEMKVTATAVRQRLDRLMSQGLIERNAARATRGRPSHRYSLTDKARRQTASNFGDLAIALWREVRAVKDPEVRSGLLGRVAKTIASMYAGEVTGTTTGERMQSVVDLFAARDVPLTVEQHNDLPVLTALACPYPILAEEDRGICALEKMMFAELLGTHVRLTDCRLDGGDCCRFQTSASSDILSGLVSTKIAATDLATA